MARLVQADRKATVTKHYIDAIQKRISGCTLKSNLEYDELQQQTATPSCTYVS